MRFFFVYLLCLCVYVCSAQPGTLDNSFGDNSKTYIPQLAAFRGCIQNDNKILIGGSNATGYSLYRFLPEGIIDSAFGSNGVSTVTDSLFSFGQIHGISVTDNNKIITGGSSRGFIIAAEFKANGSLDSTFGTNGKVVLTFGEQQFITTIEIQPDGKILLAGNSRSGNNTRMLLVRLNSDGSTDKNFAENGLLETSVGSQINSIAVQSDGKILTAGQLHINSGISDQFVINRYTSDGMIDKDFGTGGMITTSFGDGYNYPYSIKLLADGGFIASGLGHWFSGEGNSYMVAAEYNTDGSLNKNFGIDGKAEVVFEGHSSQAKGMCLQSDGKIILGGAVYDNDAFTNGNLAVARLNPNGYLDSSFGSNGEVITDFGGYENSEDVLLQSTNKIVLAGNSLDNPNEEDGGLLARYNNNLTQKQILITKIKKWIQHHNGFTWDYNSNINRYVVQRSYDGIHWSTVHSQPSMANGQQLTANSYYYNDPSPLSGTNYYRLQTTSVNGAVNYSNILANSYQPLAVSLSPNPATNVLRIQGLPSSNVQITVVDFAGNTAISQQLKANSSSSYNLNIASLKPGNYLLKIETNGEAITKSFIKQ